MTARTRFGWVSFRENCELQYKELLLRLKGTLDKNYVGSSVMCGGRIWRLRDKMMRHLRKE